MVTYGSVPTARVSSGEDTMSDEQNMSQQNTVEEETSPLVSSSPPSASRRRQHRDMGKMAAILATLVLSSLLLYVVVQPSQQDNVKLLRDASTLGSIAPTTYNGDGSSNDDDDDDDDSRMNYQVPFPKVDRADYNDPVSGFVQKNLFHPSLVTSSSSSSSDRQQGDFRFPFPTGAFWTNLVLSPTADRGISYPVAVYPYAYKWSPTSVQVSYPFAHRKEEPTMIHDYFFPDLTLTSSATEDQEETTRYVTAFDPLSVTLRYSTSDTAYWEAYLVQGSPYVTVNYQQTAPEIHALSIFRNAICPQQDGSHGANGVVADDSNDSLCTITTDTRTGAMSKELTGVQFVIQSQEGMQWLIVASKPLTLRITPTKLASTDLFDGVLRIAHIPPAASSSTTGQNPDQGTHSSSSGVSELIQHASTYPTGGQVHWSFRSGDTSSSPRIGTIQFEFKTQRFSSAHTSLHSSELLMLALPHHTESMSETDIVLGKDDFDLVYNCIKGPLTPVVGSTWAYDEVLPSLGFDGDRGSNSMESLSDPRVRSAIITNLKKDKILALPTTTENVYGFGKQSARLAQLCHICKTLLLHTPQGNDEHETTELESLLAHLMDLLSSSLETFLSGKVRDYLVYDKNLGGMVSSDGLLNTEADFGNGRYNDHHFHYGYLLYACAVMGNLDPSFIESYGDIVDAVYYDIAYHANGDSNSSDSVFFPLTRHKIWFDGHSFASGMFPFGNGKSQESSSEAVNCYYGAYLWSLVRSDHGSEPDSDTSARTDFARMLLATEIRGAKMYWHMSTEDSAHKNVTKAYIYPAQFAKNLMVGNLGMLDAICSTWFGTDPLYVHMINFIPVTSVTGDLFSKAFVSEEITHAMRPAANVQMAWRGYVVADTAIVHPNHAWTGAQDLFSPELDSGVSKSQVLYWIATRRGFDASLLESTSSGASEVEESSTESTAASSSGGSTSCQQNAACAALGLTGRCCPTIDGTSLGCCS